MERVRTSLVFEWQLGMMAEITAENREFLVMAGSTAAPRTGDNRDHHPAERDNNS
ncbi:MAG: hypothetical protein ACKO38_06550 [Planctomycetota bacterium]